MLYGKMGTIFYTQIIDALNFFTVKLGPSMSWTLVITLYTLHPINKLLVFLHHKHCFKTEYYLYPLLAKGQ